MQQQVRNVRVLRAGTALCLAMLLWSLCPAGIRADTPAPPVDAPAGKAVLPGGTAIHVRLLQDLKSGADKADAEVPYELVQDVYSPAHVLLLAAGAKAYGHITQSSRRGLFGKAGKLKFTCDYVKAPDGTHIPLRAEPLLVRGRDNRGATAAVTILVTPLGLLLNGRDVTVKKGQEFTLYVDRDMPLPAVAPAAGRSVFVLKDGSRLVGSLERSNGSFYWITTGLGMQKVPAAQVVSVEPAPAAPTPEGPSGKQ